MLKYTLVYCIIFITGSAWLIYQVAWQRYLSRMLGNDSMATAIIFGELSGGPLPWLLSLWKTVHAHKKQVDL